MAGGTVGVTAGATVKGWGRKPRSLPANYRELRLPREVVTGRIEAGQLRREGHRDAADASVYEQRGLIVV